MKSKMYIGVDACTSGWVALIIEQNHEWRLEVFKDINQLWSKYKKANIILIDIPIGLRSESGEPRFCDSAARKYLTGKRSSCIFPTPCRKALVATSYEEANLINRDITGKGLSKQTYNIIPKIIELDTILRKNKATSEIFIESQPEVCFAALNHDQPLEHYKKEKKGIEERVELLKSYWEYEKNPFKIGEKTYKRSNVAIDDILDAWVLGISAVFGKEDLLYFPEDYEYDAEGLPMRMAIPDLNGKNG